MTSFKETANIFPRRFSQSPISSFKNPIFNSKLFIDLDSNFTQSQEDSTSSEDETFQNIEDDINNKGCYLIKELIDELDSPILEQSEKNNVFNQNLILSPRYPSSTKKHPSRNQKLYPYNNYF